MYADMSNKQLLSYYADFDEVCNKKTIRSLCYSILCNIKNNKCDAEDFIPYINNLIYNKYSYCDATEILEDTTILKEYIRRIILEYDDCKKLIMDENINNLIIFLNKKQYAIPYIIITIIVYEKMSVFVSIVNNCKIDNIDRLLDACKYTPNDNIYIDSINILLSLGADIHYEQDKLLHFTSVYNRMEFLLNNGSNPNAQDGKIFASKCYNRNSDIINLMINYGVTNENLNKGLMFTFVNTQYSMMQYLIENGADVNIVNQCLEKHDVTDIVWLINYGIDPIALIVGKNRICIYNLHKHKILSETNVVDNFVYTCIRKLIADNNSDTLLYYIDQNPNIVFDVARIMIECKQISMLEVVITRYYVDIDVNKLLAVCRYDDNNFFLSCINILISFGADINYDNDSLMFCVCACEYQNDNLIRFLIDKGCDVNARDGDIFGLCCYSNIEIVKLMINCGVTNENLDRGLLYAAARPCYNMMKLLIESGANVEIFNNYIYEKVSYYEKYKNDISWLINNGVDCIAIIIGK